MERGSTTELRDLVDRFPLPMSLVDASVRAVRDSLLFPLKDGQCVLDLIVLGVFPSDVVVDTGSFLPFISMAPRHQEYFSHLLKQIDQLPQRLVCPVLDLVPRKRPQVLINRLCKRQLCPRTGPKRKESILSLTFFMLSTCAWSPSRTFRSASPTLATTP